MLTPSKCLLKLCLICRSLCIISFQSPVVMRNSTEFFSFRHLQFPHFNDDITDEVIFLYPPLFLFPVDKYLLRTSSVLYTDLGFEYVHEFKKSNNN